MPARGVGGIPVPPPKSDRRRNAPGLSNGGYGAPILRNRIRPMERAEQLSDSPGQRFVSACGMEYDSVPDYRRSSVVASLAWGRFGGKARPSLCQIEFPGSAGAAGRVVCPDLARTV